MKTEIEIIFNFADMKRWQTCLLLLGIGAMLTLADVPTDDKDDGVTVEDEKIVS